MCESGRPEQASCQPVTSTSACAPSQSGASTSLGQATIARPPLSSTTARVWCETPRCRERSSPSDMRTAMIADPPSAAAAFAASAAARPPWPRVVPVPTMPGPTPHTRASKPARPEPELAGLHVDQHVVVERNRSGQARIGDAGVAVDLEPEESFVLLEDGGDLPPPKAKRHRPRAPTQPRPGQV